MLKCTFENGHQTSLRHVVVEVIMWRTSSSSPSKVEVLLVKRRLDLVEGGKWAIAGGWYVERDEDLLTAARREAFEETGYELGELKLLVILDSPQRRGEDKQNIAFVFVSEVGERTGQPDSESSQQKWFDVEALPDQSEVAFDHLEDLEVFIKQQNQKNFAPTLLHLGGKNGIRQ
jgi:ADP-ribose pyrophosphatase YjhB (NUDIX family)